MAWDPLCVLGLATPDIKETTFQSTPTHSETEWYGRKKRMEERRREPDVSRMLLKGYSLPRHRVTPKSTALATMHEERV